jgi:hypothetical protein
VRGGGFLEAVVVGVGVRGGFACGHRVRGSVADVFADSGGARGVADPDDARGPVVLVR